MKRVTFFKLLFQFMAVILFSGLTVVVGSFQLIREHRLQVLQDDLLKTARALRLTLTEDITNGKYAEVNRLIKDFGEKNHIRTTVIRRDGVVVADSETNPEDMENHKNRPEIFQAFRGEDGHSLRKSPTLDKEMLYVAIPLVEGENSPYVLRLSMFFTQVQELLRKLLIRISIVGGVCFLLSVIMALIFSRSVARPIENLTDAARQVANGNFKVRVFLKTNDEFILLADTFNHMTEQIEQLFLEATRNNEEFQALLMSLRECLWIIDQHDRIVHANGCFRELVGREDVLMKPYWEVLRNSRADEIIERIRKNSQSEVGEIIMGDKTLMLLGVYLPVRQGVMVIMSDISETRRAENYKKMLVSSVSHELKTPLTSIKGFVETIVAMESDEEKLRYLKIIERNTERLINIVKDLLALSSLEEMDKLVLRERVDFREVINNLKALFNNRITEKGLTFQVEMNGVPEFYGDQYKLEQMLINLIDNAVKYTEMGKIVLRVFPDGDKLYVEVEDTGLGVPEHDLPHLFDRFYVVDKSRSRILGGTGLGLSIVKHIVILHKGSVQVFSQLGQGTRFQIILPVESAEI